LLARSARHRRPQFESRHEAVKARFLQHGRPEKDRVRDRHVAQLETREYDMDVPSCSARLYDEPTTSFTWSSSAKTTVPMFDPDVEKEMLAPTPESVKKLVQWMAKVNEQG